MLWFAVTAFVAIFGIGEFARWVLIEPAGGPGWWGIDLQLVVDAGGRFAAGQPIYADPRFLYPPLAAILAGPLTHLDFLALSIAYALLKVAIAVAGVLTIGQALTRWQQLAAILIVVLCLPFLHDVMLGNANVLLVGAMVPALFGRDRTRNGILLGLATAIFAKPLVLPVLLWLLVWRRQTWRGTVLTGLAATAVGAVVAGPSKYADWVQALLAGGSRFSVPFAGNHGVTALVPALWLPVAAIDHRRAAVGPRPAFGGRRADLGGDRRTADRPVCRDLLGPARRPGGTRPAGERTDLHPGHGRPVDHRDRVRPAVLRPGGPAGRLAAGRAAGRRLVLQPDPPVGAAPGR